MPHIRTQVAALGAAAALVISGGILVAQPAAAEQSTPPTAELDYFADAFPGLRENSVFTPVTHERFLRLLDSDGTYAFLIGGPADPTTRATVTHIDAVAQQLGVETVYTFDPRVDGGAVDVRSFGEGALGEQLRQLYTGYTTPLNKDTAPQFGTPGTDPYLLVYDKNHKVGGAEDRVLTSLGGVITPEQLVTDGGAAAYRAQVADVFEALDGQAASEQSQFDFFSDAVNQKHKGQYSDAALYGGDIFGPEDEAGFRLQSITYPELKLLLESEGKHTILFGGTWCHNTRAVVKDVNRAADESDTDVVYVFDLRLDGVNGDQRHIRDSGSGISFLYGDLVARYFPNLRTQYQIGVSGQVDYRPGGDPAAALATAQKLQVPYLVEYDKDRVVGGKPAPIVRDWIQDKGDGTFKEYMTEWWWVKDLPGRKPGNLTDAQFADRQRTEWAFADEAIDTIDRFFGLAAAPDAPATPTATVSGSDVTVTWTAPGDNGADLTGYRVSLDGAAAVTVPASTTAYTFTAVAAGSHTATVVAVNHIGASAASAASSPVQVTSAPSPSPSASTSPTPSASPTLAESGSGDPSLTVAGSVQPGGRITVTGANLAPAASVRVELRSTPVVLGSTMTSAAGGFSLAATIPAATAPGVHTVVVYIDGVEVVSTQVTVAATGLAATGGSGPVWGLGALGAAVVIAGATAIVIGRRRRIA